MTPRKWRLLAVALMLCIFIAVFALPGSRWDTGRKAALAFQLSTSLTNIGPKLAVAALILLSAFLFGRWYCSLLCPAGLVQDVIHRLGGLFRLRRLRHVKASPPRLRLALVALFTLGGIVAVANFLDPIGLFGRLAMPLGQWLRQTFGDYGELFAYDWLTFAFLAAGVILLVIMPLFRGRWFCDVLCPAGALLGLCSSGTAGRKIRLDPDACVSCGRCENVCPTRCLDAKNKHMDGGRCVVCLDCLDACKLGAVSYSRGQKPVTGERRNFLAATFGLAAGGAFAASRPLMGRLALFPKESPLPIVPPGAFTAERHKQRCVGCQSCVPACPVGIIRPKAPDMRPVIDYEYGYCQYNCTACNHSCPAGVFKPLALEEKQKTRLAETELHLFHCVVTQQGTECGACAEVCPTHAVRMMSQGEHLPTIPDFDQAYCIGCGACYHVCPAEPRAFRVIGAETQTTALGVRPGGHAVEAPEEGKEGRKTNDDGEMTDFPF